MKLPEAGETQEQLKLHGICRMRNGERAALPTISLMKTSTRPSAELGMPDWKTPTAIADTKVVRFRAEAVITVAEVIMAEEDMAGEEEGSVSERRRSNQLPVISNQYGGRSFINKEIY